MYSSYTIIKYIFTEKITECFTWSVLSLYAFKEVKGLCSIPLRSFSLLKDAFGTSINMKNVLSHYRRKINGNLTSEEASGRTSFGRGHQCSEGLPPGLSAVTAKQHHWACLPFSVISRRFHRLQSS